MCVSLRSIIDFIVEVLLDCAKVVIWRFKLARHNCLFKSVCGLVSVRVLPKKAKALTRLLLFITTRVNLDNIMVLAHNTNG